MNILYGIFIAAIIILLYFIYQQSQPQTKQETPPAVQISQNPVVVSQLPQQDPNVQVQQSIQVQQSTQQSTQKQTIYQSGTSSGALLELYPDLNFTGWDSNGFNSSLNKYQYQATIMTKDINNVWINFMSQKDGIVSWYYKSLKAPAGTILEFQTSGSGIYKAFYQVNNNITNLENLFRQTTYLSGDSGVFMFDWLYWNLNFNVRVIDNATFLNEKNSKYNTCYTNQTENYHYSANLADSNCKVQTNFT
jgi:hypothetical protein